jgi:hypothetical protein
MWKYKLLLCVKVYKVILNTRNEEGLIKYVPFVEVLRFSWQWRFWLGSFGLWHYSLVGRTTCCLQGLIVPFPSCDKNMLALFLPTILIGLHSFTPPPIDVSDHLSCSLACSSPPQLNPKDGRICSTEPPVSFRQWDCTVSQPRRPQSGFSDVILDYIIFPSSEVSAMVVIEKMLLCWIQILLLGSFSFTLWCNSSGTDWIFVLFFISDFHSVKNRMCNWHKFE